MCGDKQPHPRAKVNILKYLQTIQRFRTFCKDKQVIKSLYFAVLTFAVTYSYLYEWLTPKLGPNMDIFVRSFFVNTMFLGYLYF